MSQPKDEATIHVIIPDCQQKRGVSSRHLPWIGQYIADEYGTVADLKVINLGDFHDMPSLSSYDKGKKAMEGRRYKQDIEAGNEAWELLNEPMADVRARRIFTLGNHEHRITRAAEADAQLDGIVTLFDLAVVQDPNWEVYDFLQPVTVDGITYCHYFVTPTTGREIGGTIENQLGKLGFSFVKGHTQGFMYSRRDGIRGGKLGISAGSCYIHDEDYLTPQVTNYWRGIVVLHNVRNGDADLMQVSLDYLARRYEGKPLSAVKWRK